MIAKAKQDRFTARERFALKNRMAVTFLFALNSELNAVGKSFHLLRFAQARRSEILVVFDGPAGARRAAGHADRVGRARVRYAGSGRQADDLIVEMIAGWNNPAEITLVSSDNQLRSRAKTAGARVMGCAEFAGRLRGATSGSTSEDDKPLVGDIAEWEEYFKRGR